METIIKLAGEEMPPAAKKVTIDSSNALTASKSATIFKLLGMVVKAGIPGDIAEFGVFRGETTLGMAKFLKGLEIEDRKIHLFDTFEGLPDPDPEDLGDIEPDAWKHYEEYYGSLRAVKGMMHGYEEYCVYHKGPFFDFFNFDTPLAFAHIDPDLYQGVADAIKICTNVMTMGGGIVIDDYDTSWSGVKIAVERHLSLVKWHIVGSGSGQLAALRTDG
jgi:hypothetical protein